MPHLYLQLQEQLRQWLKPKDKRHFQGFAESVAAILQSGSASLSHWLPYLSHRECQARSQMSHFLDYSVSESKSLAPLSLVNIFIGTNNCGKSRLLRSLYMLIPFSYRTNSHCTDALYDLLSRLNTELKLFFGDRNIRQINNIEAIRFEEDIMYLFANEGYITISNNLHEGIGSIFYTLDLSMQGHKIVANNFKETLQFDTTEIFRELREIANKYKEELSSINPYPLSGANEEKHYYIPILRGMRPLLENQDRIKQDHNLYQDRTKKDYFDKNPLSEKMQIFTGLELYQTLKEKLLGKPNERKQVFASCLNLHLFGYSLRDAYS